MAFIQGYPRFKAVLADGTPAVAYKLYSYLAGTTTPTPTYTDQTEAAANPNPTILDGNGEAEIWLAPNIAYKLVLRTDADVVVWTVDGINTSEGAYASTLTLTGQLTSTVASPTPPLVVASTAEVANLRAANASQLLGKTWAAPDAIGATIPAAGSFTTLAVSDIASLSGELRLLGENLLKQTDNGGQLILGHTAEEITLNTGAATTDSMSQLLPGNSFLLAVTARITQAITTAVNWKLGDAAQAERFLAQTTDVALNTTKVGMAHLSPIVLSDDLGPVQSADGKVRVTLNAAPGAGKIRVEVYYLQFIAPTS